MIINANALKIPLADKSVQCTITSPPYWGLRDYGHDDQLGLEKTPEQYVANMVSVFREVWRVLKDDGVLWLNLGDTYSKHKDCKSTPQFLSKGTSTEKACVIEKGKSHSRNTKLLKSPGLKNKDLVGIPWMVAFALRSDGWYLRQDIIWHKPNPMPESVRDRCTKAHEYIFLLTKSARYYYDNEAIKTKTKGGEHDKRARVSRKRFPTELVNGIRATGYYPTANKRSVWTVKTKPFKEAHFATFPTDLVEPMVLAGSMEGDIVLDPFSGTSTVGEVATKHHREYVGTELSFDYIRLAQRRLAQVQTTLF